MDSFIGSSKLKDVLKYLLEVDHHLPDDTLLNRLLDLINLCVTLENIESSGLKWFMEKISTNPSRIELSVLTFSLSLCGKLCEKEDIIEEYFDVITKLLDQIKPMIKDSSIATAYFTCLTSLVQIKHGLHYINQNKDYQNIVLDRMKNGESMFVKNAASTLVYTLLNLPDQSEMVLKLSKSLLTDLNTLSQNTSKSRNIDYTSCMLSLFYKLGESDNWKHHIDEDYFLQVLYSCLKLYQNLPTSYIGLQLISDVIVKFIKVINGKEREEFINKVENDIILLVKIDVVKSHHAACHLAQICPGLNDVVSLPSDIMFNRNNGFLNTESAISKTVLSSIIVQYLSCDNTTVNINDQIELIIKCIRIIQDKDDHQYKHYLLSNKSLLSKILHHLQNKLETCTDLKEEKMSEIYCLLLDAVSAISTDITTLKSGTSCMLIILSKSSLKDLDLTQFIRILEMKLCDTGWEIRDTALEIINQLVSIVKDDDEYKVILPLCCIGWSSRTDSNSYVRVSVLTLISTIVNQQSLLYQFLSSLNISIEDLIDELTSILKDDSEAFPRRAAVKTLDNMYQICDSHDYQVIIGCAMLYAMEDFDWEVKILVLQFWEKTILKKLEDGVSNNCVGNNIPSYASGLPESLQKKEALSIGHFVTKEFSKSLLLGYNDYEQSVKEKACVMIDRFLKIWMNKKNGENEFSKDLISWIDKLQCLSIETSIDYNSDEYSKNPISLLEDILATAGEQDEENFVDCY